MLAAVKNNKNKGFVMFAFQKSCQAGFSLLEVLIALLILSISLLAFAQAELTALRNIQNSYFINIAILQSDSLAEELRACENQKFCINHEIKQWQARIPKLLPQGKTKIDANGLQYQIEIRWHDNNSRKSLKEKLAVQL